MIDSRNDCLNAPGSSHNVPPSSRTCTCLPAGRWGRITVSVIGKWDTRLTCQSLALYHPEALRQHPVPSRGVAASGA